MIKARKKEIANMVFPPEEWISFIKELKEPKDDIERSRYHYLCYTWVVPILKKILRNIIAIPALLVSVVISCAYTLFSKHPRNTKQVDAVALVRTKGKVQSLDKFGLPEQISEQYKDIEFVREKNRTYLITNAATGKVWSSFTKVLCRYPVSFYMLLSIWLHLMKFNRIIDHYHPKAIISSQLENDFTSSLITNFCESSGVKNISVMHGEYLASPRRAFVRFSEYYIWDSFYIKQFEFVGCPKDQFIVYTPDRYKMRIQRTDEYDCCYYLQTETESSLSKIREVFMSLQSKGYKCIVRPHPKATDMTLLHKIILPEIEIEDYSQVDIATSLSRSKYIISRYSTVLSEAINNNLVGVIDDLSDIEVYEYLTKTMYINLEKTDLRLSKLFDKLMKVAKNADRYSM